MKNIAKILISLLMTKTAYSQVSFETHSLMNNAESRQSEIIDFDKDGDQDLTVVGDWMPIKTFENNKGKFKLMAIKKFDMSTLLNNQKELKGEL